MKKFIKYTLIIVLLLTAVFFSLGIFVPEVKMENSVEVNSSVHHSFAVFENVNKMKEWMPGFKSIELTSGLPFMPKSTYRLVLEQDGRTIEMKETLIAIKTNRLFSFTLENEHVFSEVEVRFSGDDKKTVIAATTKIRGQNLFWRSMVVLGKGNIRTKQQEMYDAMKKVIEQTPRLQ
jgi:hypothetical protein